MLAFSILVALALVAGIVLAVVAGCVFVVREHRRRTVRTTLATRASCDGKPYVPPPADRKAPTDFSVLYPAEIARWTGDTIVEIVDQAADYVVYVDDCGTVSTSFAAEFDEPDEIDAVWARSSAIEAIPVHALDPVAFHTSRRLIAHGVALGLRGACDEALLALAVAEKFVYERLAEVSRYWHLCSALLWTLIIAQVELLALILAWWTLDDRAFGRLAGACIVLALGAIGAFCSIAWRISEFEFSPAAGLRLHVLEAGVRVLVGGIGAGVLALAFSAGVLPALSPSVRGPAAALVLLVAFFGGFSERAVGILMSRMEEQVGTRASGAR
jgi:hypothetical protein